MTNRVWWISGLMLLVAVVAVNGQSKTGPVRRAQPPQFDDTTKRAFFADIFAEGGPLVGERPASLSTTAQPTGGSGSSSGSDAGGARPEAGSFAWSQIVSATTIEDEIKAIKMQVDKDVDKLNQFKSRGYKACRTHFSMLGMLFAIIQEYDGDVRFKKDAAAARDLFAKAGRNCKVATDASYKESKIRKAELQDLIGGAGLQTKARDPKTVWEEACERSQVMKRLETAVQGKLQGWTANKADFNGKLDEIKHEAELVAAISEVLMKDGMEDAGDEDYDGYARRMKDAALNIVDAVKLKSDESARKAVGEINKACTECHESYRA